MGSVREDSGLDTLFSCLKEYRQEAAGEVLPSLQDRFLRQVI